MAEELLSLKWNNHQAHFVDILTLLREKDMFIDATIACGGKVYSAHKFVLSTCSDYFKQIFTRSPNSNPIVFMKDVSCRDIEALLDFMYNGEVSVPQSSLGSLIKTAEGLQIKGLAVPDDPPSSRRQQERDKREREPSLSFPENRSPPPKRRVREKNTPPRRLSNHQQQSRPSNSTTDNTSLEINPLQNNDSSENSSLVRNNSPGAGPESSDSSSKKQHNNINANSRKHSTADEEGDEDRGGGGDDSNHDDDAADNGALQQQPQHDGHEGSLGTAAITHSKQEEMEIKQEDVVDLGEDDDGGDWGDGGGMGDGGADDGGVGGADSLSSADNTVNFSDVLLAHSEGGAMAGGSGAAGDSAMDFLLDPAGLNRHTAVSVSHRHRNTSRYPLQHPYQQHQQSQQMSHQPRTDSGNDLHQIPSGSGSNRADSHLFGQEDGSMVDCFGAPFPSFVGSGSSSTAATNPADSEALICPICGKVINNQARFQRHMLYHRQTSKRQFQCTVCNKLCVFESDLRKHMRVHTGEKPYACTVCAYRTGDPSNLSQHMITHAAQRRE